MLRATIAGNVMRLIGCTMFAAALAALFGGSALAAPLPESSPLYSPSAPIVDENPEVSAEFKGTITQESTATDEADTEKTEAKVSWSASVRGPVDEIEYVAIYNPSIHWHVNELSGTVTWNATKGKTKLGCTASFSPTGTDAGIGGVNIPLSEPGFPAGGGNPATNSDYEVHPPDGALLTLLKSSYAGPEPECETKRWNSPEAWVGAGITEPTALEALDPTVYFPAGNSTLPFTFPYDCAPLCNKGTTFKAKVSSSLTFSSPGLPSPSSTGPTTGKLPEHPFGPPNYLEWLRPSKEAARNDLDPALQNAKNYCTPFGLGFDGFGTGALLLGSGAIGGVLVVAGSLTATATEPFCVATLKRVAKDVGRYKDPPDADFDALARAASTSPPSLPSCSRWHGASARFCKRLRPAELAWVRGAQEVASIDEALSTTTNRVSAAIAAGDSAAVALQSSNGRALEGQERSAIAAKDAAGLKVAAILRGAHLRFRLSRARSTRTIAAVHSALSKLGIPASTLAPLAGASLKPGAVDLLAALGT